MSRPTSANFTHLKDALSGYLEREGFTGTTFYERASKISRSPHHVMRDSFQRLAPALKKRDEEGRVADPNFLLQTLKHIKETTQDPEIERMFLIICRGFPEYCVKMDVPLEDAPASASARSSE